MFCEHFHLLSRGLLIVGTLRFLKNNLIETSASAQQINQSINQPTSAIFVIENPLKFNDTCKNNRQKEHEAAFKSLLCLIRCKDLTK